MIALSNHQFQELQAHTTALQAHSQAILDILTKVKQQELTQTFDPSEMYPMRPMTKKELANMLGVSSRHLAYQIQKLQPQLRIMGISDRAKLLPPNAVFFICSAIDIEKK